MRTNNELRHDEHMYALNRYDNKRNELRAKQAELDDIYAMSEEAACRLYNVDTKDEIITMVEEVIAQLYDEVEALEPCDMRDGTLDPAFSSWSSLANHIGIC